jgi:serine protease AprX
MRRLTLLLCAVTLFWPGSSPRARYRPVYEITLPPFTAGVIHPDLDQWAAGSGPGSRIWVRFRDRGSAAGSYVAISDRAVARRVRQGIPLLTADRQPVAPEYLEQLRGVGATIRHVSRWLNAASVDYDPDLVDRIALLPSVARIEPVHRFGRMPDVSDEANLRSTGPVATSAGSLSYGPSAAQLTQIGVDLAHARGYTGAGVLVAMFDTGFRKDHVAFATAIAEGRLIDEWDFVFGDGEVQNEPDDNPSAQNHGTSTWSVLGGAYSGELYGPAYGASFLLAKTEDIRSETPVEEDNWLAAVEWAEGLGAEVISSSLVYSDWYSYSDYDGRTAVTTLAADLAVSLGIVVCNSAGNAGPAAGTIGAPVDAFGVISVGSVTSTGSISSFSSHGPTYDGRIKPEVCARGSSDYLAQASSTTAFGTASGTSFSCPLTGGCAALLVEAHPDWNPLQVREALMQTAGQAQSPDNTFGWGILNVNAALDYTGSVEVTAAAPPDTLLSYAPDFTVHALATAASGIDFGASALYYRTDGGSYANVTLDPLTPDSVVGLIPSPTSFRTTLEYYLVAQDSVGFSARAPQEPNAAYQVVLQAWLPGDVNKDRTITVADILELVNYVLKSAPAPDPFGVAEVDGIQDVTLADIIYLVNYVFKGGPAPILPTS